jgi:hypothetical protein
MKKFKKPVYKETWFIILIVLISPFLIALLIAILPLLLIVSPGILVYFMWKKTNWNKKIKIVITSILWFFILLIIMAIIGWVLAWGKNTKEMLKMAEAAQYQINESNIAGAKDILLESKQKFKMPENPAIKLEGNINQYESEDFLKKTLTKISDADVELLNKNELQKVFIENEKLNFLFLNKLKDNLQLRTSLVAEAEKNKQLAEKMKKEQELAELKTKTQEERKAKIEKQFSAWDGKHMVFSRMIQENLKDPDSFKHVETRYEDKGDYILVAMKYRWTNWFWAVITEYANAKFTIDWDFIGLVE